MRSFFEFKLVLSLVCGIAFLATDASAQKYKFNQAFDATAPAIASGAELQNQPNLFVMEVQFRPMGIMKVELTDPITNKKEEQLVWYQVYRTLNRKLDTPVDDTDTAPVNPRDQIPRPYLIPEFFLVVLDDDNLQVYPDQILPEAVKAIEEREKLKFKNSVEIIQRIPEAVANDTESPQWIYGVATWKGIDPDTDYYTVFAEGFSNGYQIKDVAGTPLMHRKTIVMDFWRPGDNYNETDIEIRRSPDAPKPIWIYRPSGSKFSLVSQPVDPAAKAASEDETN